MLYHNSILGSEVSEVTFTVPVKQEVPDNLEDLITQHSPECELRVHITNIVSLQHNSQSPPSTEDYSTIQYNNRKDQDTTGTSISKYVIIII